MKIKAIKFLSGIVFCALLFTACNNNVVYTKYIKFEKEEWYSKDKAVFDVEITDVQSLNNISLMIRHADSYPYSNVFLFVETTYPDGKKLKDTMEVILSNSKGEWQGSGAGDLFDIKVPIKKNVRFPMPGKYKFEFQQAMRTDPLPLILDFGFEIEKAK
ncbi:MAG: gliding motility lipoprotein GldH [Sphingobacteriaceae bacterium]|jgi:gliding motility-associated lipoprotein GldH